MAITKLRYVSTGIRIEPLHKPIQRLIQRPIGDRVRKQPGTSENMQHEPVVSMDLSKAPPEIPVPHRGINQNGGVRVGPPVLRDAFSAPTQPLQSRNESVSHTQFCSSANPGAGAPRLPIPTAPARTGLGCSAPGRDRREQIGMEPHAIRPIRHNLSLIIDGGGPI
jgi:hypothetical protein